MTQARTAAQSRHRLGTEAGGRSGELRGDLIEAVDQLPRDALPALLVATAARILKEPSPSAAEPRAGDRVLTAEEAARKLNQTPDWLARNGRRLRLLAQFNGKGSKVGYSEHACERLIANALRENGGPSR